MTGTNTDSGRVILVGNPILSKSQEAAQFLAFNPNAIAAPPYAACEVPNPAFICWGSQ